MRNDVFVNKLKAVVEMPTIYVLGGFGLTLNDSGKARAIKSYSYNAGSVRKSKINSVSDTTFGFDCCGLVKGVLWGFSGDHTQVYGGAVYQRDGITDLNTSGILTRCTDVITVSSVSDEELIPGMYLWMDGHCGVYIGDGYVVESTPQWADGVQITNLGIRKWVKAGKLPWVEYVSDQIAVGDDEIMLLLSEIEERTKKIRSLL